MESAFLIPVPFFLAMLIALLAPQGRRWLGYAGAGAGAISLLLVTLSWSDHGVSQQAWFSAGGIAFPLSVLVDNLSLLLAAIVSGIGILIFWYSIGYLDAKEDLRRYYALMALFAFSMLCVVLSANLFQLFFFWELVGVSSYLLIGFWHHKESAVIAARKAFLTIIVGDAFFLAGILLLHRAYGTFDVPAILASLQPDTLTLLGGIGIIVGAISKSAQFPLHAWLPDAMEGPTPVSAFLHSATMVKAGLFLIARMLPLLLVAGLTPWIILIAAVTIILSACMALVENDIKRVLAYSTMNQLAFILLALGLGAVAAGLFQLLTHSVFKALLFMSAGILIHTTGTQDITAMHIRPKGLVWLATLAGTMALAGLPPFSGFFSKDAIYEAVLHSSPELVVLFSAAIVLSAAYIFRWLFLIFRPDGREAHGDWHMLSPLPLLAVLSLAGGAIAWWFMPWMGAQYHLGSAAIASTILALLGAAVAYLVYRRGLDIAWLSSSVLAEFFRERFFLDRLTVAAGQAVGWSGRVAARFDDAVINRSVRGAASLATGIGLAARHAQTGRVTTYVAAVVIGFLLLVVLVRFT